MKSTVYIFVFVLTALAMNEYSIAQDQFSLKKIEAFRIDRGNHKSLVEYINAEQATFASFHKQSWRELLKVDDTWMRIQAKWQLTKIELINCRSENERKRHVENFLGFVEGSIPGNIPSKWMRILRNSQTDSADGSIVLKAPEHVESSKQYSIADYNLHIALPNFPKNGLIEYVNDEVSAKWERPIWDTNVDSVIGHLERTYLIECMKSGSSGLILLGASSNFLFIHSINSVDGSTKGIVYLNCYANE